MTAHGISEDIYELFLQKLDEYDIDLVDRKAWLGIDLNEKKRAMKSDITEYTRKTILQYLGENIEKKLK